MIVLDSKLEIKTGVGLNTWPNVILNKGDCMIPNQVLRYLGSKVGDKVSVYVDWGSSFSGVKAPRAHLFAMLTAGMENVTMNFEHELIMFNGTGFPFELLGIGEGSGWDLTYKIKGTYEEADGKFSEVYGNVVLIDCHYLLNTIIDEMYHELK